MKFIVIGLGNFGTALATRLTSMGHEVIGADGDREKTELFKDAITSTICMDVTNEQALSVLPLKECDFAIVTIGEDFGASVMSTALLKQSGVKKLVSRAISPMHYKVLEALGVDLILQPEYEAASRFADSVLFSGVNNSFDIAGEFKIVETKLPERYEGLSLKEVDFVKRYNLSLITIIRSTRSKILFGQSVMEKRTLGFLQPEEILQKGDILVMFGNLKDFEEMLGESEE
ncbi:MAG: TrkA family potassium uptake protein [Bacteroidales bacterium]|jgi:trk system potassium uptake protein TrkA|nr:TrkA family potassium uptake protein [Bacteroidales bacterium]